MKPCPFCGSNNINQADVVGFPVSAWYDDCHACGPAKLTAKEADEAWGKRSEQEPYSCAMEPQTKFTLKSEEVEVNLGKIEYWVNFSGPAK